MGGEAVSKLMQKAAPQSQIQRYWEASKIGQARVFETRSAILDTHVNGKKSAFWDSRRSSDSHTSVRKLFSAMNYVKKKHRSSLADDDS